MIKRLTKKADCGYLLACFGDVCDFQSCDGCPNLQRAILRLGAYEDTGMEPEEIKTALDEAAKEFMAYDECGTITHLRELVQAEKEGRLVVLPCKTGDIIYQLRGKNHAQGVGISPRIVSCAHVWSNGDYSLSHQGMTVCRKKDLGKTWFLTREEAEAALVQNGGNHETDI